MQIILERGRERERERERESEREERDASMYLRRDQAFALPPV